MSEYVFSNEIVSLAVNLEDGSWRVVATQSGVATKCYWYEEDTGELLGSALGQVLLLERPGETTDGAASIYYEVETPGVALDAGQIGVIQRVYVDINTRGERLETALVLDGGDVRVIPALVQTPVRQIVEVPTGSVSARLAGVRLWGAIRQRVDLYEIALDVSIGIQEHQAQGGGR
jgi:hypothetical protein